MLYVGDWGVCEARGAAVVEVSFVVEGFPDCRFEEGFGYLEGAVGVVQGEEEAGFLVAGAEVHVCAVGEEELDQSPQLRDALPGVCFGIKAELAQGRSSLVQPRWEIRTMAMLYQSFYCVYLQAA